MNISHSQILQSNGGTGQYLIREQSLDGSILSLGSSNEGSLLDCFIQQIPTTVRQQIGVFDYRQTAMLQWVARSEYAADLLSSNPLLLWCLVHLSQLEAWEDSEVIDLLKKQQRIILNQLVSVNSKSAVQFLRKIDLQHGGYRELCLIFWTLRQEKLRNRLAHMTRIPIHMLAFVQGFPESVAWRWTHTLPTQLPSEISHVLILARRNRAIWCDILRLAQSLNIDCANKTIAACRSLNDLQRLHDRWTCRLNDQLVITCPRKAVKESPQPRTQVTSNASTKVTPKVSIKVTPLVRMKQKVKSFGSPPLRGNEDINPILNTRELRLEGKQLSHCAGSYVNNVINKRCFIYQVLRPQRATLEIIIKPSLSIGQCKLKNNGIPSEQTLLSVQHWFAEQKEMESVGYK